MTLQTLYIKCQGKNKNMLDFIAANEAHTPLPSYANLTVGDLMDLEASWKGVYITNNHNII